MKAVQKLDQRSDVRPYVRGISLRVTTRGTLLRFFPACSLGLMVVDLFMSGAPSGLELLGYPLSVMMLTGYVTLGYWLALEGMRRWLYPDAAVDGRRSVVAGLMAGPAFFCVWIWILESASIFFPLFPPATAFVLAMAMFLPWLSPTPGMADIEHGSA